MISIHSSKRSTHTGPVEFLYNNLTPREFEKMLCLLFKRHIIAKKEPYCHQYDDAHLMTGVGEKGRDISLSLAGESVGLVQCKREKNNLSDVACAREIIKFTLNAICSPQLITNRDHFTYYLTASTGFSDKAIDLLKTFNRTICQRPELQTWTETVINKHELLGQHNLAYSNIERELKDILSRITIRTIVPTELDNWLVQEGYHGIAKQFFPDTVLVSSALIKSSVPTLTDEQVINQLYDASSDLRTWPATFEWAEHIHLEREETAKLLNWINEPLVRDDKDELSAPVALLVGGAGYGKTTVMQDLLKQLHNLNMPVIGLKADRLSLLQRGDLERELHLSQSIDELIRQLAVSHLRIVVLVDQLDALSQSLSANRQGLLTYNRLIEQLATLPNIRLVISCRHYDLEYDPALVQYRRRHKIELQLLSVPQVDSVLEKLGLIPVCLPSKLRELLRVPLHLDLFCRVYRDVTDLATLTTLQDLYHEIWSQKILNVPASVTSTQVRTLMGEMAHQMYQIQEINLPYRLFESDHKAALNYLSSESLLIKAGKKLEFFHQSFFDYVFARSFVDQNLSLTDDITGQDKHQGLFIRSKVRQVLAYLREVKKGQYEHEIRILLTSADYRFHLKLLTLEHLASQSQPLTEEYRLLEQVIKPIPLLWETFLEAVSTANWFRYIIKHFEKSINLADTSTYNRFYQLCRRVQAQCPNDVVQFLNQLPTTPERSAFIGNVLFVLTDFSNSLIHDLFEEANKTRLQDDLWFYHVMEHAIPFSPEWVISQVKIRLLESIGQLEVQYNARIPLDRHSHQLIDTLEKLHEQAPEEAFTLCLSIVTALLQKAKPFERDEIGLKLISDTAFHRYAGENTIHDVHYQLLAKLTSWLNAWFAKNPNEAIEQVKSLLNTDYLALVSLGLCGVISQPSWLANIFFEKITGPFWLAEHDWLYHDFFSKSVREALKVCFPYWSDYQQETVIDLVLSLNIKQEYIPRRLHKSNLFTATGITQYELLNLLPPIVLTQYAQVNKRYQELFRKFDRPKPRVWLRRGMATVGGKTLSSDAYERMSDTDWLNSFKRYDARKGRDWDKPDEQTHAQRFEQAVSRRPERFELLIGTIINQPDIPDLYVYYGLEGLAKADYDLSTLKRLLLKSINRSEQETYLRWMIHLTNHWVKHETYDVEIFEFLESLAIHGEESVQVEDNILDVGASTVRGTALLSLYRWVHVEPFTERCFRVLEEVAANGQLATRATALSEQGLFIQFDRPRSLQLFLALCARYEVHLAEVAIDSLQDHIHTDFLALVSYLEKAVEASDALHLLAQVVMVAYWYDYPGSSELLELYAQKGEVAINGILDLALTGLIESNTVWQERCSPIAFRFLSNAEEEVNQAYLNAFRQYEVDHFKQLFSFLKEYAQSEAGRKRDSEFYRYLLKCVKDYPKECIYLASYFDRHLGPDFTQRYLQHEPINVILQAYSCFKDLVGKTPEKELAMDVFDRMLMNSVYRDLMNSITEKLD